MATTLESNEPNEIPESPRAYTDKAKEKLLEKVLELTKEGKYPEEIMKLIGRDSIVSVYNYQNILAERGLLEKNPVNDRLRIYEAIEKTGNYVILSKEAFVKIPTINKYFETKTKLAQKDSEKELVNDHTSALCVFCNTVLRHPDSILFNADHVQALGDAMREFRIALNENRVAYLRPNNVRIKQGNGKTVSHDSYTRAWASLFSFYNKPLPRQRSDSILQRSRDTSGAYVETHLTYHQYRQGLDFIQRNSNDRYRTLFGTFVHIFPRTDSIYTNPIGYTVEWEEVDGQEFSYGLIEKWYESKSEGTFPKLIIDPEVRLLIDKYLKPGEPFFDSDIEFHKHEFNDLLRKFYISLNLLPREILDDNGQVRNLNDPKRPVLKKKTDAFYLDQNPSYTLRHTGAFFSLCMCGFDFGKVARQGWKKMDTLLKYYANEPLRNFFKAKRCLYCNPPIHANNEIMFCSYDHALIWFHTRKCKPGMERTNNYIPEKTETTQIQVYQS